MSQAELMKQALAPKSDQLNADDLIAGPITVRIRRVVVLGSGEQRISVFYDGDNDKPYKPGKSMGRVIAEVWGIDPAKYIGKHMTLYRDPHVKMKGEVVGGIRISHIEGIDEEREIALTEKRGSKKPFTVKPLVPMEPVAHSPLTPTGIEEMKATGVAEANKGSDKLKAWWGSIGGSNQKQIGGAVFLEELKTIAAKVVSDEGSIM